MILAASIEAPHHPPLHSSAPPPGRPTDGGACRVGHSVTPALVPRLAAPPAVLSQSWYRGWPLFSRPGVCLLPEAPPFCLARGRQAGRQAGFFLHNVLRSVSGRRKLPLVESFTLNDGVFSRNCVRRAHPARSTAFCCSLLLRQRQSIDISTTTETETDTTNQHKTNEKGLTTPTPTPT